MLPNETQGRLCREGIVALRTLIVVLPSLMLRAAHDFRLSQGIEGTTSQEVRNPV